MSSRPVARAPPADLVAPERPERLHSFGMSASGSRPAPEGCSRHGRGWNTGPWAGHRGHAGPCCRRARWTPRWRRHRTGRAPGSRTPSRSASQSWYANWAGRGPAERLNRKSGGARPRAPPGRSRSSHPVRVGRARPACRVSCSKAAMISATASSSCARKSLCHHTTRSAALASSGACESGGENNGLLAHDAASPARHRAARQYRRACALRCGKQARSRAAGRRKHVACAARSWYLGHAD